MEKIKLKIVGDGSLLDSLRAEYKDTNIEFLGEKSQEETQIIIKNSLAVVTATKMFEGQPRLLCEASSDGVPSIFAKFGGLQEYFPTDYSLSFQQFNYEDLKNKINLLRNNKVVNKNGLEAYSFLKSKIQKDILKKNFDRVLNIEK